MATKKRRKINIDFCVVGAQKAGTTSLHEVLSSCEIISLPWNKESNYFLSEGEKNIEEYLEKFHQSAYELSIVGEVNPEYCTSKIALRNLYKINPAIKIILIIRDPYERAISQYNMNVRRGLEHRSFIDAVRKEIYPRKEIGFDYIKRSCYEMIKKDLTAVFSKENIMYIGFNELIESPEIVLKALFEFIEVPNVHIPKKNISLPKKNANARPKLIFLENLISRNPLIKRMFRYPFRMFFPSVKRRHRLMTFIEEINHKPQKNEYDNNDRLAFKDAYKFYLSERS